MFKSYKINHGWDIRIFEPKVVLTKPIFPVLGGAGHEINNSNT